MSARSTCSSVIPYVSAKNAISTAVKHFRWMPGRIASGRAADPCSTRTASPGCRPLTMWTSVSGWSARSRSLSSTCSSDIVYALGVAGPQPRERTEQTARHADVRRFEPQVEVVVRDGAVTPLALAIGEPARPRAGPDTRTAARRRRASAVRRLELVGDVGEAKCLQTGSRVSVQLPITRLPITRSPITMSRSVRARGPSSSAMSNALPLPQHDFPAAHLQREAVAEQHRAQVRVGVHAIAVRVRRIVVAPRGVASDDVLEERPDVGRAARLELVDEDRARRVHREQVDDAFFDAAGRARAPSPVR